MEETYSDNRQKFLGANKPHLLYFWQKLDEQNILNHTLLIISLDIAANSDGVPSTLTTPIDRKRKHAKNDEIMSTINFQKEIQKSFANLAISSAVDAANSSIQLVSSLQSRVLELCKQRDKAGPGLHK
jgi:hypothetical protein